MGAFLGGITSIPVMAIFYWGERFFGTPFVPFDRFDWLARSLPGNVVTAGIDAIVLLIERLNLGPTDTTSKLIEQLLALGLTVLIGLLLGAIIGWATGRNNAGRGWLIGLIVGLLLFFAMAALELASASSGATTALLWLLLVYGTWGALLGHWLGGTNRVVETAVVDRRPSIQPSRRAVVAQIAGGSAAVALAAWGAGRYLAPERGTSGAGQPLANLPTASPTPTTGSTVAATAATTPSVTPTLVMREQVAPAPGTRSEITANEDFYRIDINTRPPVLDRASWQLEVAGLFDNTAPLTLDEIMAMPAITQPLTLSCISNRIGGDLISASAWTGVRLRDLLRKRGLQPSAQELALTAADGFYESVTMMDMMDPRTLLVYGMNGETLPVEHGFPLRIYIPNRYGMKQPKWITEIEAIPEEGPGYWVERGWNEEARPHIISIIDNVATEQPTTAGAIPIGGIAWAGDRGIQRVELQIDEGEWHEAVLRTPPLSPLIWVQWRYDWPAATAGQHTFRVRAVDGTGTMQIGEESGVRPDGATGYHEVSATL
jgi:DMSO/TMAO reductase YedYZ molybdopterin-dependent catalytic subunit